MSVVSQPMLAPAPPTVAQSGDALYRLSVDQYHAMVGVGIICDDDPVELLDGLLVQKMTKNPPHTVGVLALRDSVMPVVPSGWFFYAEAPVTLSGSEPEPDGAIVKGSKRDYKARRPVAADVAMMAEVSDDSLKRDRTWKLRLYAQGRIPVYWIINLVDSQIEVYTQPTGPADQPGYASRQDYRPGDMVPLVINGVEVARIAVDDLLP